MPKLAARSLSLVLGALPEHCEASQLAPPRPQFLKPVWLHDLK